MGDRIGFALTGLLTALIVVAVAGTVYPRLPGPSPEHSGRMDVAQAVAAMERGDVQVIDVRSAALYERSHLPGARSIPISDVRTGPDGMLASPQELAARLDEAGISPNQAVLIYADKLADAAYLGWTLVSLGHNRVYLLDGGIAAWIEEGGDLETGAGTSGASASNSSSVVSSVSDGAPGVWSARAGDRWPLSRYYDLFDLYDAIDDPNVVFVDTRAADARQAAIQSGADPDADYHVNWQTLVSEDGRRFNHKMALHRALQVLPARKQLIVYGDATTDSALVWWSLYEHGYAQVARFDEPFEAWESMGFPTRPVSAAGGQQSSARLGGGCG